MKAVLETANGGETLLLTANEAAHWLGNYLHGDRLPLSLRFAAAPYEGEACLVFLLRAGGRGIDLLVPASQCHVLRMAPSQVVVRSSGEYPDLQVEVLFDEDAFAQFAAQAAQMRRELPDHAVWRALSDVLADEYAP